MHGYVPGTQSAHTCTCAPMAMCMLHTDFILPCAHMFPKMEVDIGCVGYPGTQKKESPELQLRLIRQSGREEISELFGTQKILSTN